MQCPYLRLFQRRPCMRIPVHLHKQYSETLQFPSSIEFWSSHLFAHHQNRKQHIPSSIIDCFSISSLRSSLPIKFVILFLGTEVFVSYLRRDWWLAPCWPFWRFLWQRSLVPVVCWGFCLKRTCHMPNRTARNGEYAEKIFVALMVINVKRKNVGDMVYPIQQDCFD